jgi:hypothetical protein
MPLNGGDRALLLRPYLNELRTWQRPSTIEPLRAQMPNPEHVWLPAIAE